MRVTRFASRTTSACSTRRGSAFARGKPLTRNERAHMSTTDLLRLRGHRIRFSLLIGLGLLGPLTVPGSTRAQQAAGRDTVTKMEIYGFGQGDMIFDARRINPEWFDVVRPTKLPAFGTEFNANGNTYFGARQSRFGVKARTPTDHGDMF